MNTQKTLKILFLICAVLLTNCYSTKKLSRKSTYSPSNLNKFGINGLYENSLQDSTSIDLWTTLKKSYRWKWDIPKTKKPIVKLELIYDKN